MQLHINWKLFSNQEVIVDEKNKFIEKIKDQYIYKDDGKHIINVEEKTYERVLGDSIFKVDFKKNKAIFKFDTGEECEIGIVSSLEVCDEKIELRYTLDEEEKIIRIEMVR